MAELDSYMKLFEGFRASDEARERLVSVRFLSRVPIGNFVGRAKEQVGYHRKVQSFIRFARRTSE
jgi:hypothetical protein